jgi:DNA-binding SARP family transcriptional activator/tetratricopeptide (TPR) repeat protein
MIRLKLLGGLAAQTDGTSLDPEQHRKTLVLLAVVAAAEGGIPRDKLLAYFWPESDAERARNALRQRLFALRRHLGSAELFVGTTDLRLNPTVVTSDLAEFESAVAAGDVVRAADLYTGPLLDGVHVNGASELDRWLEVQRSRVATRAAEVLKVAAGKASARRAHAEAARRWRQLLELDATNADSVLGLLAALDDAGDSAGALQQARVYETLMRVEYGAEPDLRVAALANAIRKGERRTSVPMEVDQTTIAEEARSAQSLDRVPHPRARRTMPDSLRGLAIAGGVLALAFGAFLGARWSDRRESVEVGRTSRVTSSPGLAVHPQTLDRSKVVVAAFEPLGASHDTLAARVEQLARDWLTRGLLQTGLVTVIPAGALIDPAKTRTGADDLRPLLDAARAAGAGLLISGAHYRSGDSLFLTARLTAVGNGAVYRAIGPIGARQENALHAIEQLRQRVMAALAMKLDKRMANWSTVASQPSSFEAYQAFADGLAAFFEPTRSRDPYPYFRRAHALDTSFVTPLLWMFFDRGRELPGEDSTLKAYVSERRDKLPSWDQGLVDWAVKKSSEDGYQAFRKVVEAAPQSEWLYMLAWTARVTNRPATAKRALRQLEPSRGWMREWPAYWTVLADAHHDLGEYAEELAAVRRGLARFPMNGDLFTLEIRALAALGEKGALKHKLAELTYASPRFSSFPSFEWLLRELRRHGYTQAADSVGAQLLKEIDGRRAVLDPAHRVELRLTTLWALDRWDEAAIILDSLSFAGSGAVEEARTLRYRALIAASRGQRDKADAFAKRWWQSMERRPSNGSLHWATATYTLLRACIQAHLGNPDEAMRILRGGAADRLDPAALHAVWPLDPLYSDAGFVELASRHYDDPEVLPPVLHDR